MAAFALCSRQPNFVNDCFGESEAGLERPGWVDSDQRSHRGKRRVELPLTFEELTMDEAVVRAHPEPWNKGKLVGQKAPFKLKEIWAIRVRLQLFRRARDLALFDLGIDSKLRACDLVRLKVRDVCHGDRVAARAIVMQQKTSRPVQFEITESTREAVAFWINEAGLRSEDYLFPSRLHESPHLSTRQYAHIVDSWVEEIGSC
jgi:integrase